MGRGLGVLSRGFLPAPKQTDLFVYLWPVNYYDRNIHPWPCRHRGKHSREGKWKLMRLTHWKRGEVSLKKVSEFNTLLPLNSSVPNALRYLISCGARRQHSSSFFFF